MPPPPTSVSSAPNSSTNTGQSTTSSITITKGPPPPPPLPPLPPPPPPPPRNNPNWQSLSCQPHSTCSRGGSSISSHGSLNRFCHAPPQHPPPPPPPPPPPTASGANISTHGNQARGGFLKSHQHENCSSRSSVSSQSSSLQHHYHHNPQLPFINNNYNPSNFAGPNLAVTNNNSQFYPACCHPNHDNNSSDNNCCGQLASVDRISCGQSQHSSSTMGIGQTHSHASFSETSSCNHIGSQNSHTPYDMGSFCNNASNTCSHINNPQSSMPAKCQTAQCLVTQPCTIKHMNTVEALDPTSQTNPVTTTISRNTLLCNTDDGPASSARGVSPFSNILGPDPNGSSHNQLHRHHYHHNTLHSVQFSSGSSLSSSQPVDATSSTYGRSMCSHQSNPNSQNLNMSHQGDIYPPTGHLQYPRPPLIGPHRVHRATDCCHTHHGHHQVCNHQPMPSIGLDEHCCGHGRHHDENYPPHHNSVSTCAYYNNNSCSTSAIGIHHHCNHANNHQCPTSLPTQPLGELLGDTISSSSTSMLPTTHIHNLSNSSTTTHTGNVTIRHQPEQRSATSTGSRGDFKSSNPSRQNEQYGPSSAASNSSATMNMPSYHATPVQVEDSSFPKYLQKPVHLHPPPLPAPLTRLPGPQTPLMPMILTNKSRQPETTLGSINYDSNSLMQLSNSIGHSSSSTSTSKPKQFHTPLPPLPLKLISPGANKNTLGGCGSGLSTSTTQITTLRTSSSSPSSLNQPITRVTSQAGVQNPLPESDIPPPLPPLNPGSRSQALINSSLSRNPIIGINEPLPLSSSSSFPNFSSIGRHAPAEPVDLDRRPESQTAVRQLSQQMNQPNQSILPSATSKQLSNEPLPDICPKCDQKVSTTQEACRAMNRIYHSNCFSCCKCNRVLVDKKFHLLGDKIYCEDDFEYAALIDPVVKCAACALPIYNMILHAMSKPYHPKCFKCCICGQCLDGVLFTIDLKEKIYCVKDYHSIYSPKCAACGKSIAPIDGTDETVRVVSMDKDFHIDCYCCEDCGQQLTDEKPNQSYPLDNHLLCQRCHINRLSKMQAALSLS